MGYVGGDSSLSNFVGVFAINLSVNTLQNYTTDVGLVKKAIERAGAVASSSFESKTLDSGSAIAAGQRDAAVQAATCGRAVGRAGSGRRRRGLRGRRCRSDFRGDAGADR